MKILIIEDEVSIRQTLQDLLEINGYTVSVAADGEEGVKLARLRPDLILCDICMPKMDGFETIAAIQQLPECHDLPFIFLTARVDREDQRRGMALGADDYITKPFTEKDILEAIAARIRRQQPLRVRIDQLMEARTHEARADWSHELMTPLTGVLGGLDLIEDEIDTIQPAELKELLGIIRAGAERQHALSSKIVLHFELERVKAARPPNRVVCDAAATLVAAARLAAGYAGRSGDLTLIADPGTVPASQAHLNAAVSELAGNAFYFSKPGQPVTVTGTRHDAGYRIEVIDQGLGMTPEQCAAVGAFTQFGRGEQNQQGLGLGLAIARSVVEIAGGRFSLQSGPGGRGLHATLDFPCG